MPRRLCLVEGCGNTTTGTRCEFHEAQRQAVRNAGRPHLTGPWQRITREAVAAWRAEHGDWCPGYGRSPHPATDLTTDHVEAGTLAGGVAILCRSCNSRKGAR